MADRPRQPATAASVPSPGSNAALAMGCQCPVIENNYGEHAPYEPDGWYIEAGCRVHWPPKQASGDG